MHIETNAVHCQQRKRERKRVEKSGIREHRVMRGEKTKGRNRSEKDGRTKGIRNKVEKELQCLRK